MSPRSPRDQVRRAQRCRQTEIRVVSGDGEEEEVQHAGISAGWIAAIVLALGGAGVFFYCLYKCVVHYFPKPSSMTVQEFFINSTERGAGRRMTRPRRVLIKTSQPEGPGILRRLQE